MEEDWDIIESTTSSTSSLQQKSLIGLDFNRFANQPVYTIEDDDNQDYDQELIDQGVIFDDSPVLKAQINLNQSIDDVEDMNNELEQQRINHYKRNIDLDHFFPFIMSEEKTTRESNLEKTATWQNSTAGSSVPYMSNRTEPIESLPDFAGKFSDDFSTALTGVVKQSPERQETINRKLGELQLKSEKELLAMENELSKIPNEPSETLNQPSETPNQPSETPNQPSETPNKPIDTISLALYNLPSFAAKPKSPVLLTSEARHFVDIPPVSYIRDPASVNIPSKSRTKKPASVKQNLSECFQFNASYSQDSLLSAIFFGIENVVPDIAQWHQLKSLDLSRCNLTNFFHLDTYFPMLEKLTVSHNELKSISGLPMSLRYLYASHNKLHEVDIYKLNRLQHLNISHNAIQTLQDMSELKSLRSMDASNNALTSCIPFQTLTGLLKLSLRNNKIEKLTGFLPEQEIESLDLSCNRIEILESVNVLRQLVDLNVNNNNIKQIAMNSPMRKICSLRLSFNRLKDFDVSLFPQIRALFLDDNQIQKISGVNCIAKIDSFSLRDQGREKVAYNLQYLRGTRKLYLSGSPFRNMHQLIDFYSLEYMELCSTGLEELPNDFSKRVPNLRHLYLSMNRLQNIRPLKKLKYLKSLVLIDNSLLSITEVLAVVKQLTRLKSLDIRQNPMCSNFYPTLSLVTQKLSDREKVSPYIATAHDATWAAQDLEFTQQLEEHWKVRRDVYRALLIKECPKLKELDNLVVHNSDRACAETIIDNYRKSRAALPV